MRLDLVLRAKAAGFFTETTMTKAWAAIVVFVLAVVFDMGFSMKKALAEDTIVEAEIPRYGGYLAFGFDSLWMMSGKTLIRVKAADNSFVDIPVEGVIGGYRAIAIGEGAVWIPDVAADAVYKIDPATGTKLGQCAVAMQREDGSIGVGEKSIWVIAENDGGKILVRLSSETCREEARIPLPSFGMGVVADYGSVWVTGYTANQLYRIDPHRNVVAATVPIGGTPVVVTSAAGSVWVLNYDDGSVQRIDGQTGAIIATIKVGHGGTRVDIASGGGYVWVATDENTVAKIDPMTNSVVNRFNVKGLGDGIRYGAGSLWVSGSKIQRIKPPN
jgi:virginiamycin B lyase